MLICLCKYIQPLLQMSLHLKQVVLHLFVWLKGEYIYKDKSKWDMGQNAAFPQAMVPSVICSLIIQGKHLSSRLGGALPAREPLQLPYTSLSLFPLTLAETLHTFPGLVCKHDLNLHG